MLDILLLLFLENLATLIFRVGRLNSAKEQMSLYYNFLTVEHYVSQ